MTTRLQKASGIVELPFHIRWSEPSLSYDLSNRAVRLRVYEQVLREGTEKDVRCFIEIDKMLELWNEPAGCSPVLEELVSSASVDRPCMLSPLQERVASIIGRLEEAHDFALEGGAALIVRGAVNRGTRDLDFFGLNATVVNRLIPAAEEVLREAGLEVERVQSAPGFTRIVVTADGDRTEVDLASDARVFRAEQGPSFLVLSSEELAIDKVLAALRISSLTPRPI